MPPLVYSHHHFAPHGGRVWISHLYLAGCKLNSSHELKFDRRAFFTHITWGVIWRTKRVLNEETLILKNVQLTATVKNQLNRGRRVNALYWLMSLIVISFLRQPCSVQSRSRCMIRMTCFVQDCFIHALLIHQFPFFSSVCFADPFVGWCLRT